MDEEAFTSNMNTLKELVLDENKLVTYYSISKDLCIHVNESKQLMKRFVDEIKNTNPSLNLNLQYIISGLTNDGNAKTMVCSEKDMEVEKKNMKIVFFEHIYSLCKGLSKVDKVALLSLSKFEDFALCTGLVKSRLCLKRSITELDHIKSNSQEAVVTEKATVGKSNILKIKPGAVKSEKPAGNKSTELYNGSTQKNGSENTTKVHETKSEPIIKGISPKKDSTNNKQKVNVIKNGKSSQKGIAGFFSKSNSDPGKKIQKEEKKIKEVKEIVVKEEKMDVDIIDSDADEKLKKGTKKNKAETKLSQIKKNAKVDKKRKRVLHVSDSESETENNDPFVGKDEPVEDVESEDEIPPTPAINTVKVTSGMLNPKKKRKIVDKTYMDDEGYIHTKKEEVYESCSDNEEKTVLMKEESTVNKKPSLITEVSPKDKKKANGKKKPSPPQKGKQATLTNFFKRKE